MLCFVTLFSNVQAMLAEPEQPESPCDGETNESAGLCPECFTCIRLCNSMWLIPM